jgi:hypothetical protein
VKRYILLVLLVTCIFVIISFGVAQAVTVSSSPNPSDEGQSVTANMSALFPGGSVSCTLQINWGDSTSWQNLPACSASPCIRSANHTFTAPGIYTISVRPGFFCSTPPNPPTNPSTTQIVNAIEVVCPPLSITTVSLPAGTAGQAYSQQIQSTGGYGTKIYSVIAGSLPTGLILNSSTGAITGTPTLVGTYPFTIRVADSCPPEAQMAQQAYSITITPTGCIPLSITSPSVLSTGTVGSAYTYQITASGGQPPISFSLLSGSLPPGMNLGSTGLITGMPTSSGNYTFTVRATDSCAGGAQTSDKSLSITVNLATCPPLSITSPSVLSTGTVGSVYTYQLTTSGGQVPITFSLVGGSLPPGLNLSATGLISGLPTTAGNYTFMVSATDSCAGGAQIVQKIFSFQVQAAPPSAVNMYVTPSSVSIPRGQSSANSVNYQFTGGPSLNTILTSSSGSFILNGETIEVNAIPLTVNIINGSGKIAEVINVPVRVTERALQRKATNFIYTRTFVGPGISMNAVVSFAITTEAGAAFEIKRIELYFENRRAEATVERDYPHLRAFADIRFVGSGLLEGYWEVDGRRLSTVAQNLLYGSSVILETPEIPPLPTYDTGTHIVRFIITKPETGISLPSILYFVTPEEFKAILVDIKLMSPIDDSVINYAPLKFEWENLNKSTLFVIQYFDKLNSRPVFSAYTKEAFYSLPVVALEGIFSPGQRYYWKVRGYDTENNIIGESKVWSFTFRKFDAYVPGQILTVFPELTFSEKLVNELEKKYPLKLIDSFSLKSVNLTAVLFEATKKNDIFKIIEELRKDKRVLIAQPNYILRTMSDPLRKMQYVNDILKVDKIHSMYRGHGIRVAVLDTGVDANHSDLKDRVVFTKNFVRGEQYLAEIHGTAIAGVIAASINGFGIEGIAPDADILAMRSCEQVSRERPEGKCFTESLSKALDEAIMQKVNIVNMSFGTTNHDSLITKLIDKGVEQGMLFIASAGNLPNETELEFPASYPSVIAVGGLDESLTPYPNPDITKKTSASAPAVNIIATVPDNKHNFMSGTSMSSAYISGILSLALEKDKSITKQTLPTYKGDICKWEEELLKMKICEK